jgi:hypothetical protein
MGCNETQSDVLQSIEKHIAMLKPTLPEKALICIGEYPTKILLKGHLFEELTDVEPLLIGKSSKEIVKWSQSGISSDIVLGLDSKVETHYWYNVLSFTSKNDTFVTRLKEKAVQKQYEALILSSVWEGIGSALLPFLTSTLRDSNMNTVGLTIMPSSVQPSDVHFNALYSIGLCSSQDLSTIILVDRDLLEAFTGVNRNGSVMEGNIATNYLLELMLTNDSFVQELSELSRTFNVKLFTILHVTGASLKLYESLENMLNSALSRPLLKFDISSSSVLYVLLRMPEQLKESLPKGKIELTVANWFKERASLKSIYVSEPIYVDEMSDRIDILLIAGGFSVTSMMTSMEKRVKDAKDIAVKKGFIKEDEWQNIVGSLVKD